MAAEGQVIRGRPPKPDKERLSEPVSFRLTASEADYICRRALRARVSVHQYIRALVRLALTVEISRNQKPEKSVETQEMGLLLPNA